MFPTLLVFKITHALSLRLVKINFFGHKFPNFPIYSEAKSSPPVRLPACEPQTKTNIVNFPERWREEISFRIMFCSLLLFIGWPPSLFLLGLAA